MKIKEIITEASLKTNWTDSELEDMSVGELKKLSQKADDFGIKQLVDRIASVIANKKASRPAPQRSPKQSTNLSPDMVSKVMMRIDDAISRAFPDSDPLELLVRELSSEFGVRDYQVVELLDQAVLFSRSGRDYHDYVRTVWQQHIDDNPGAWGENPF